MYELSYIRSILKRLPHMFFGCSNICHIITGPSLSIKEIRLSVE